MEPVTRCDVTACYERYDLRKSTNTTDISTVTLVTPHLVGETFKSPPRLRNTSFLP